MRHLTHICPRFKTLSGGETAMLKLTTELERLGVRSTVLTRGYSSRCDPLRSPEVDIVMPPRPWTWITGNHLLDSFLDVWLSPAMLAAIPDDSEALLFHTEATAPALWWAKRVRRTDKPCVYLCYQPPRFAYDLMDSTGAGYGALGRLVPLYSAFHRWFDRRWVRQADAVWTFSKAYGQWCRELYGREQVACIPPGVDQERFSAGDPGFARRRWDVPPQAIVLVTVNKLIPRKNLDVFLEVVRWLRDRGESVKGFIVGDGPSRAHLESLARQSGIDGEVVFTGHVAVDELPHYYAGGDVYLFLERNVPFGMTPVEAAAAGTPVIAPRGGGATETVVDGETGYLVDDSLPVEQIGERVLAITSQEGKREEMGRRARRHARQFTWERYARQILSQLDDVQARP